MEFISYSNTLRADELKISRLVAPASLSDIEDGPGGPANIAFAESLRKRLRPFPVRELGRRSPSPLTAVTGVRGRSISREVLMIGRHKAPAYPAAIPRRTSPRIP